MASAPLEATVTPRFDEKDPPKVALTYTVTFKGGGDTTVPHARSEPPSTSAARERRLMGLKVWRTSGQDVDGDH